MGKVHEIAGDGAPMPGFDDGMVDMAGPIRVMAESPVNEAMGARADGARESGNRRNGYRGPRRRSRVVQSPPRREVAHRDDGRRVLGDGRGPGGPPPVRRRLDRQGRRGRRGQRARARLRGRRGRARGRDHRARGGRRPDSRREGGAACVRMTAFQAIPGSSDSLRPPSRTEPYTNFRDTTQRVQEAYEEALTHACGEGVSSEALDIDGGDSARQAAHPVVQADTRSREPFGSDSAPDSTERPPLHGSLPASDEVPSYVAEERCSRERTDADAVAWLESRATMVRENIAASSERALLEHREQNDAFICQELARRMAGNSPSTPRCSMPRFRRWAMLVAVLLARQSPRMEPYIRRSSNTERTGRSPSSLWPRPLSFIWDAFCSPVGDRGAHPTPTAPRPPSRRRRRHRPDTLRLPGRARWRIPARRTRSECIPCPHPPRS